LSSRVLHGLLLGACNLGAWSAPWNTPGVADGVNQKLNP
jgi:hypothetical protein